MPLTKLKINEKRKTQKKNKKRNKRENTHYTLTHKQKQNKKTHTSCSHFRSMRKTRSVFIFSY